MIEHPTEQLINSLMLHTIRQVSSRRRDLIWVKLQFPIVLKTEGQLHRLIEEQLEK